MASTRIGLHDVPFQHRHCDVHMRNSGITRHPMSANYLKLLDFLLLHTRRRRNNDMSDVKCLKWENITAATPLLACAAQRATSLDCWTDHVGPCCCVCPWTLSVLSACHWNKATDTHAECIRPLLISQKAENGEGRKVVLKTSRCEFFPVWFYWRVNRAIF